jgi:hypothetical protein
MSKPTHSAAPSLTLRRVLSAAVLVVTGTVGYAAIAAASTGAESAVASHSHFAMSHVTAVPTADRVKG